MYETTDSHHHLPRLADIYNCLLHCVPRLYHLYNAQQ